MDSNCLAILAKRRTLDLVHNDLKIIQKWLHKINSIIFENEKRSSIPHNPLMKLDKSSPVVLEAINEIWRSEILMNWNRFWDSRKKTLR
jgi:hypothetical protein